MLPRSGNDASHCSHTHRFDEGNVVGERSTRLVVLITAVTMVVEILAGWGFNSMALLADGWHMSSHALALGLSTVAYGTARRYASDARFAFGTWKMEILAGFASAMFLLFIAVSMVIGSVERLLNPQSIHFTQAIAVAILGLAVNLVSALILGRAHRHGHDHEHGDEAHHHDLNLKSAYLHVLADAATSIAAIVALVGGLLWGWVWLDPTMGIAGAILVGIWAVGLIKDTGTILLDAEMDRPIVAEIRRTIESMPWAARTRITDLHAWRVGKRSMAMVISLSTTDSELEPQDVKDALTRHAELVHVSVEINRPPRA